MDLQPATFFTVQDLKVQWDGGRYYYVERRYRRHYFTVAFMTSSRGRLCLGRKPDGVDRAYLHLHIHLLHLPLSGAMTVVSSPT